MKMNSQYLSRFPNAGADSNGRQDDNFARIFEILLQHPNEHDVELEEVERIGYL